MTCSENDCLHCILMAVWQKGHGKWVVTAENNISEQTQCECSKTIMYQNVL